MMLLFKSDVDFKIDNMIFIKKTNNRVKQYKERDSLLDSWKKQQKQTVLYEEKPELKELDLTAENIKAQIGDSNDVNIRDIYINGNKSQTVSLIFVDGMVNSKNVDDDILKPLLQEDILGFAHTEKDRSEKSEKSEKNDKSDKGEKSDKIDKGEKEVIDKIMHGALYHLSAVKRDKIDDVIEDVLSGFACLVFSNQKTAISFDVRGFEKRSVSEPTGENVIKGSKDSFIEVIRVNTALIRRKIKSQNLRIKETKVGQQTVTQIAVAYIEGIADDKVVKEVFKRLDGMNIEGILSSSIIEGYLIDHKFSVFPQIMATERPDKFCANLIEGRVGIIADGMPIGYILPATWSTFLQAPEDYANNYVTASLIRILRYLCYFISLGLPAFYIAVTTFHQEMIPTDLAVAIAKSKEGVPFPTYVEVILMIIAFEILTEAGLQLPKNIGQAVSIIGSVVVGQAAVSAKLVSPGVVIVVAFTGIAGFTMPNQDFSNGVRIWRFILLIFAVAGGLFDIVIGLLIMGYLHSRMELYGVPYLAPFESNEGEDIFQDTLFRPHVLKMNERPSYLKVENKQRQEKG